MSDAWWTPSDSFEDALGTKIVFFLSFENS